MISDKIKFEGHVTAELYEQSDLIQKIEQPNLVVDTGKSYLTNRILNNDLPLIDKIGIGAGSSVPLDSDTVLDDQTGITTILFKQIEDLNVLNFIATFPEGVGSGDIREVGLFAADNTMICRTTFTTPFNKQPSQFLNITWKLQVA
jgi:hypothetical protein